MNTDVSVLANGMPSDAGKIVPVTDDPTAIAAWLARTEALHRQLRPDIPTPYADHLRRMFEEGAEMAVLTEADTVWALAIYRCYLTTFHGRRFYVDDLVADEAECAQGYGARLLAWCEVKARERGCGAFDLEFGLAATPHASVLLPARLKHLLFRLHEAAPVKVSRMGSFSQPGDRAHPETSESGSM